MTALKKWLREYKKATNGEPDRLLVIEAMEKILTVVEEHFEAARSRRIAVSTMSGFLHDANDILEEGAKRLRMDGWSYERELEKYNRLIDEFRAFSSLPSPAQAILIPLPEKPGNGTDIEMQEKEI